MVNYYAIAGKDLILLYFQSFELVDVSSLFSIILSSKILIFARSSKITTKKLSSQKFYMIHNLQELFWEQKYSICNNNKTRMTTSINSEAL